MSPGEAFLLFGAAVLGGALNSVAGGGSFFTFPALVIVAGIPAVPANATSALALWPGSIASATAYRKELSLERARLVSFGVASLLGGVAGALILVLTPPVYFEYAVPFLLLLATALFAAGPRITAAVRARRQAHPEERPRRGVGVVLQFVISIYGGYFGGGMGMMMLAAFSLLGMQDIHRMNGLKAFLAVAINVVALVTFIVAGVIVWREGLLMMIGASVGGYGGAWLARRIDPKKVRVFVVLSGGALTAVFFYRTYFG